MKKIVAIIPIAILIILLSIPNIVYAQVLNTRPAVMIYYYSSENVYLLGYLNDSNFTYNARTRELSTGFAYYYYSPRCSTAADAYNYYVNNLDKGGADGVIYSPQTEDSYFIVIKGNCTVTNSDQQTGLFFNSYQDYDDFINPPEPDPTWWENMWNELGDTLGDPNFWFGEWFINIIDNIFGNGEEGGTSEHSISTHVQIENPTLTPAPTPIPYSTVIIPKTDPVSGDTYYETNYYYNNPSGTPIVQPYPPTNPPSADSPSNGTDYIPIGGDPYSIPVVNWLTSTKIGDTDYDGIDSVGSGLDSIDSIGSEYNDGMGAVQDATGTLPTSWLLLIGIAAAIPLIAGIISRFLS